jgi:hypothetical protein
MAEGQESHAVAREEMHGADAERAQRMTMGNPFWQMPANILL